MNILIEQPPNIKEIEAVLTVTPTAIFTYGNTIYNPNNCPLDIPLLAHEETHSRQQGDDPEGWWKRYLRDAEFRIEQEVAAYQVQYWVQCQYIKKRDIRALNLQRLAETLASSLYGQVITVSDAKKIIKLWKPKKRKS